MQEEKTINNEEEIIIYNYDKIVNNLIEEYNTIDPFRIADELDAIVVKAPLEDVNGFYQRYLNQHIIYINQDLSDEEQMLVCAHELGHMILHKDLDEIFLNGSFSVSNKYELEANAFALQLLQRELNLDGEIPLINWNLDNTSLMRRVTFVTQ